MGEQETNVAHEQPTEAHQVFNWITNRLNDYTIFYHASSMQVDVGVKQGINKQKCFNTLLYTTYLPGEFTQIHFGTVHSGTLHLYFRGVSSYFSKRISIQSCKMNYIQDQKRPSMCYLIKQCLLHVLKYPLGQKRYIPRRSQTPSRRFVFLKKQIRAVYTALPRGEHFFYQLSGSGF